MVFIESLLGMSRGFFDFWGYIVVFATIFIESFPFLGAFVPGGVIALLVCGFLTKLGYFELWKIIPVAVLASVAIDSFGYWFGRSRDKGFLHRKSRLFFVKHATIDKVIEVVNGHTGKSLIIGKINPVTRAIAPFVFGNERVSWWKFSFFSVVGSLIWVVCFVFLGYVIGDSYQFVASAERYILWLLIVFFGGFYVYWLGNLFKEYLGKKVEVNNECYYKEQN
jgi:membrane protein DedA with SNARE-associated domain